MSGREIAFDFGLMISIWFIGILLVTAFFYGIGNYDTPQAINDITTELGTTKHAIAQFLYMVVVIFGLLVFFWQTMKRRMI